MRKKITFLFIFSILVAFQAKPQEVGKAAPDFSLETLSNGTYKLAEQSGKVVVIFFLGNQCGNCRSAAPNIQTKIFDTYSGRDDFSMIGIDTWGQSSARLPGFKSATGVTFPLGVDGSSVAQSFGSNYDKLAVIDKNGVLVHKTSSGGANGDIDNALEKIVEALDIMATSIDDEFNKKSAFLSQNYPNPVSGETTISFNLKEKSYVDLIIYDITGKIVSTLVSEERALGNHEITFNASTLNSGIYYYQLNAGDYTQTRRMMVR
jgi:peroxiredoxin